MSERHRGSDPGYPAAVSMCLRSMSHQNGYHGCNGISLSEACLMAERLIFWVLCFGTDTAEITDRIKAAQPD